MLQQFVRVKVTELDGGLESGGGGVDKQDNNTSERGGEGGLQLGCE